MARHSDSGDGQEPDGQWPAPASPDPRSFPPSGWPGDPGAAGTAGGPGQQPPYPEQPQYPQLQQPQYPQQAPYPQQAQYPQPQYPRQQPQFPVQPQQPVFPGPALAAQAQAQAARDAARQAAQVTQQAPDRAPRASRGRVAAVGAATLAAVMLVALCVPGVLPGLAPGLRSNLPWFPPPPCDRVTVLDVVATPLVAPTVSSLVAPLQQHRMADDSCLSVRVRAQEAADTIASSGVLPPSRAPQLWLSDSSLWPSRITNWRTRTIGSFATTPVIMVSSAKAVQNAGWTTSRPNWVQLFAGTQNLSMPGLTDQAQGQLAMVALWQSAGRGGAADRALTQAALAARRSPYTNQAGALSAIVNPAADRPDADAPFVTTTEQAMVAINRDSMRAVLTPVYPTDGSPFLDFPIVRVAEDQQDAPHAAGTDLVVDALGTAKARDAAHVLGLRNRDGADAPTGQLGLPAKVARAALPSAQDLTRFSQRWTALASPSRLLTVIDVSASMRSGSRPTRLELAGKAAAAVGDLLPDISSAGLWAFSLDMDGDLPYRALAAVDRLGSTDDDGQVHRRAIQKELQALDGVTGGGGTALYVTALAAVRAVRASYDIRAANAVVLFTDGSNQNDDRLTLPVLVETLRREAGEAKDRPVRLICIGLGAKVDMKTLQAMSEATGGTAYQAQTAADLQSVLYDAIARRS